MNYCVEKEDKTYETISLEINEAQFNKLIEKISNEDVEYDLHNLSDIFLRDFIFNDEQIVEITKKVSTKYLREIFSIIERINDVEKYKLDIIESYKKILDSIEIEIDGAHPAIIALESVIYTINKKDKSSEKIEEVFECLFNLTSEILDKKYLDYTEKNINNDFASNDIIPEDQKKILYYKSEICDYKSRLIGRFIDTCNTLEIKLSAEFFKNKLQFLEPWRILNLYKYGFISIKDDNRIESYLKENLENLIISNFGKAKDFMKINIEINDVNSMILFNELSDIPESNEVC